jgi:hypothetical protein
MAMTMAQILMPGRMAMARLIFRVMAQFEKRKLRIAEESEHEEGRVTRDSLDENQSGEDQDLVDPDEAVHKRLTQVFLMQAGAEDSQTPIGKAWNCRRGREVPDFGVFMDFFYSSFYFVECYLVMIGMRYSSNLRTRVQLVSKQTC